MRSRGVTAAIALASVMLTGCAEEGSEARVWVDFRVDVSDLTVSVGDQSLMRTFTLSDLRLANSGREDIRNAPRVSSFFPVTETGSLTVSVDLELNGGDRIQQTASFRARPEFRWAVRLSRSLNDPVPFRCQGQCASVRLSDVVADEHGAVWLWWDGIEAR